MDGLLLDSCPRNPALHVGGGHHRREGCDQELEVQLPKPQGLGLSVFVITMMIVGMLEFRLMLILSAIAMLE